MRPFRVIALGSAIWYNFLWFGALSDLFWLYFGENKQDFDDPRGYGDVFMQLFLSYSLITCVPNLLINGLIIFKEASLPIFQLFFNKKAPSDEERLQLALVDFEDLFLHYLNPAWLFQQEFEKVEGYDPVDMVIENKNDEEHYYTGRLINKLRS